MVTFSDQNVIFDFIQNNHNLDNLASYSKMYIFSYILELKI